MKPELVKIERGWAAVADWWAVFGKSRKEAMKKFRESERKHREIASRDELGICATLSTDSF